jgi:hypothetical protein
MRSQIVTAAVVSFVVAGGVAAWAWPDPPGPEKMPARFLGLLTVGDVVVYGESSGAGVVLTIVTAEKAAGGQLTPAEAEEIKRLEPLTNQMPRNEPGEPAEEYQRRMRVWKEEMSRLAELYRKVKVRNYEVGAIAEDYVSLRSRDGRVDHLPQWRIASIRNERAAGEGR